MRVCLCLCYLTDNRSEVTPLSDLTDNTSEVVCDFTDKRSEPNC